jgi:hypothetical protein
MVAIWRLSTSGRPSTVSGRTVRDFASEESPFVLSLSKHERPSPVVFAVSLHSFSVDAVIGQCGGLIATAPNLLQPGLHQPSRLQALIPAAINSIGQGRYPVGVDQ